MRPSRGRADYGGTYRPPPEYQRDSDGYRRESDQYRSESGRYNREPDYYRQEAAAHDRYDRQDDRYDRQDRYHAERTYGQRDRSPPRPRLDTYSGDVYSFRGAARNERRPQDDFSFDQAPTGPRFPPSAPSGSDGPAPRRDANRRPYDQSRREYGSRGPAPQRGNRTHAGRGGRPRFGPPPAHTRDILHKTGRSSTPEQLSGMNADGHIRFVALNSSEDGSESGELVDLTQDTDDDAEHRPRKRARPNTVMPPAATPPVTQWSNPDVYTSLPPPDHISGPKKDIVQFIRKAKVDAQPQAGAKNAVSDNVDFISFGMDADGDDPMSERGEVRSVSDDTPPVDPHAIPASSAEQNRARNGATSVGGSALPSGTSLAPNDGPAGASAAVPSHPQSAGTMQLDLTGPPPAPPPGLVMPTDQELMTAYATGDKFKKRKRNELSSGLGAVTPDWQAEGRDSTPWYNHDKLCDTALSTRLHREISEFFNFVQPLDHEDALRRDLIDRVQLAIRSCNYSYRRVEVQSFGSFAAGIYLPTADMDLVALSQTYLGGGRAELCRTRKEMFGLARHFERGLARGRVTVVAGAKVPILKFVDAKTNIKVDISFENLTGVVANDTFNRWKAEFPAMPVLVVLIKQMLLMRNLNEVHSGGIGGFTTICLVTSLLQLTPDTKDEQITQSLDYGDLLLRFLDLYGNKFNIQQCGIVMEPSGYFDKVAYPMKKQNGDRLTIQDPNDEFNDISGGSRNITAVLRVFGAAHAELQRRFRQLSEGHHVEGSILGGVLGGNYAEVMKHRRDLAKLYPGASFPPQDNAPPPPPLSSMQPPPPKQPPPPPSSKQPPPPPSSKQAPPTNGHVSQNNQNSNIAAAQLPPHPPPVRPLQHQPLPPQHLTQTPATQELPSDASSDESSPTSRRTRSGAQPQVETSSLPKARPFKNKNPAAYEEYLTIADEHKRLFPTAPVPKKITTSVVRAMSRSLRWKIAHPSSNISHRLTKPELKNLNRRAGNTGSSTQTTERHKAGTPTESTGRQSEKARATTLKALFPGKEIPRRLSKPQFSALKQQFEMEGRTNA